MSNEKDISQLHTEEITNKGEEIYKEKLQKILEPAEKGKYVAIEVESGQYFVGETKEEAIDKAQKVFPNKVFFVRRIGELEKVSFRYSFDLTP